MQLLRYYNTLRHLKPCQFTNRLKRNLFPPKPDLRPPSELAGINWKIILPLKTCWDGESSFTFLNEVHQISDWNDPTLDKLWLYNLHYFDCLRSHPQNSESLIKRWILENPPGYGNGWDPYPLSLRIVNWIKFGVTGEAIQSLAEQLRYLACFPEYHLLGNHLMANAKALILGGVFFRGSEAEQWSKLGWKIYRKQLPEQILTDGGHFERSLMYHSIILEDLLDVYQATRNEELVDYIQKMVAFLVQMTGPDGRIALFNDAAFGIAPEPHDLLLYAQQLGFAIPESAQFQDFPESGYCRMSFGDFTLLIDAAPIGPDYQPGHAHADALTYELFFRDQRIICDGGTSCYRGEQRRYERGTAAHNTVQIDDRDSSEVWGEHRVGCRSHIVERIAGPEYFSASHDGYGDLIRRCWRKIPGGVEIVDECNGTHEYRNRLHFTPDSRIEMVAPDEILVGGEISIHMKGAQLLPDSWSCEFGKRSRSQMAVSSERVSKYRNIITVKKI
ncbi:hypothetical protein SDC9_84005 [bioreactor metagenome]|uniref:Uncharacterized protein n=1 Tax=bioreactor metagenome TaxID=1076179 RepID=A0A644ZBX2_9ZZZZ